ncbi:DgaE family pyridoxal phosphate-dependent ammonia lyase [Oceanobacillus caeni]|uniref:DgaE family pyridoxal phosphate-dependent ammonia lyase n=1 Tax=Oceanobacillus caeni TaxID=405946 RepID=UPI000622226F|nr:DgaE family pyridoxal phosphate-dependent ammonia lyase [Oceanobacillus caeni]KKE77775.1 L-seryl-tRNA selenium transferase [Bacilli bacterium VT-13-104]PZD87310.1 DgaE family pyridoxal phosphate-dependent ammonia lyase [Bacilli bacterium]MCR1835448.1 DgaE family pyridoxal phosphate-dependent ammonia lyase [Oceanobacillus caeni]PZD88784.1 DgaE family pyridoxal phosphate-dependent ammonia lyase [Bacilli bacterium]PZD91638.1 DgaE family pyridoxal phosphate-dependent ammonia lyase [Bacilli bact
MENTMNAKYGLKRVINASGRMSILGVSAPTDTVMEAMKIGGQNYVEISDLVDKAGAHIAELIQSEAAVVVNSASSGIALSVAAIVTEGNRRKSEKLHQEAIEKNEIIMLKGHNVQYGAPVETMVSLGGGKLVEVGYANEGKTEHIADAINENTAAILFVKSHHAVQKNMISVEEAWEVAQENHVPLIVDAAAEEDLKKYVKVSDLAIYSGSKAIEGPTSGIVAGKKEYIEWVKVQLHCIGRSMKVGKETTFGLLQALDEYFVKKDNSEKEKASLQVLTSLESIDGIKVTIVQDEAGRAIFRARIQIDPTVTGTTAKEVNDRLRNGDIAIYTRDYGIRQGFFDIDPRPLQGDDIYVIEAELKAILTGREV